MNYKKLTLIAATFYFIFTFMLSYLVSIPELTNYFFPSMFLFALFLFFGLKGKKWATTIVRVLLFLNAIIYLVYSQRVVTLLDYSHRILYQILFFLFLSSLYSVMSFLSHLSSKPAVKSTIPWKVNLASFMLVLITLSAALQFSIFYVLHIPPFQDYSLIISLSWFVVCVLVLQHVGKFSLFFVDHRARTAYSFICIFLGVIAAMAVINPLPQQVIDSLHLTPDQVTLRIYVSRITGAFIILAAGIIYWCINDLDVIDWYASLKNKK